MSTDPRDPRPYWRRRLLVPFLAQIAANYLVGLAPDVDGFLAARNRVLAQGMNEEAHPRRHHGAAHDRSQPARDLLQKNASFSGLRPGVA